MHKEKELLPSSNGIFSKVIDIVVKRALNTELEKVV